MLFSSDEYHEFHSWAAGVVWGQEAWIRQTHPTHRPHRSVNTSDSVEVMLWWLLAVWIHMKLMISLWNFYVLFICLSDVSGLLDCTSPVNGNSNRYQHPTYTTHMKMVRVEDWGMRQESDLQSVPPWFQILLHWLRNRNFFGCPKPIRC